MRLFVAVPLPPNAVAEVSRLLGELRGLDWPVRWVRNDGLHITLKFFGEVTSDRADPIEELVQFATRGMKPMELVPESGGAFPSARHPRVLRLEVRAGPELELLQDRLERGGEAIGFPPEGRPFRPHITLGRVREGQRLPSGAVSRLEGIAGGPPFTADRVVLFESRLTPEGPVYGKRIEQVLAE
ncbi:MAG: RNA 2',3'-cyclic phosphodiesterase [Gemmatimonadales bacterium]|nr:RNA 2',3'-cyclic phosphodiesterase [Gemmatimonadales bacterium]